MVAKGIIVHWGLGAAGQGAQCLWSNHCELCQWDGIGESVCQSFSGYGSHHSGCPASQGLVPVSLSCITVNLSLSVCHQLVSQMVVFPHQPDCLVSQSVGWFGQSVCLGLYIGWVTQFGFASCNYCWAKAPIKIARMTLTIKLDGNWSSFQLANSTPPLSVTDSAIAPSARMTPCSYHNFYLKFSDFCCFSAHPFRSCCITCFITSGSN